VSCELRPCELRPCELRRTLDFGELRPLDNLTIFGVLSCEMFDFFQKVWYDTIPLFKTDGRKEQYHAV
jgi:hypothetical protein